MKDLPFRSPQKHAHIFGTEATQHEYTDPVMYIVC